MNDIVQNRPGSDLDGLVRIWPKHLVWKQAVVQESSGPVSGRTQPARYHFPSFRLGSVLPQTSRINIVQNQARSDLVLTDCVRFGPNGSGPEVRQYEWIIRSASGQCFPADPDRIRIGSSMFTGLFRKIFTCLHSAIYMVTAANRLQLFICLCPKPVGVIRHSLLHVRCVSCLCPRTVSISWYCMFHNGCISCCVFGHFTAAPRHGIRAGRSGKNQFICRLETGLHFFLGNTNVWLHRFTCLLRN